MAFIESATANETLNGTVSTTEEVHFISGTTAALLFLIIPVVVLHLLIILGVCYLKVCKKPSGHCQRGTEVFTIHMGPECSRCYCEDPGEEYVQFTMTDMHMHCRRYTEHPRTSSTSGDSEEEPQAELSAQSLIRPKPVSDQRISFSQMIRDSHPEYSVPGTQQPSRPYADSPPKEEK